MPLKTIGINTYIIFFVMIACFSFSAFSQHEPPVTDNNRTAFVLLKNKIEYYKHLYPEILFLNLEAGDDISGSMVALDLILGYQPVSLDYEHPPELREDLMYVSSGRILFMLQNNAPSASMFKADDPHDWQEYICVLTISPAEIAADSFMATGHLLNLSDNSILKFPAKFRLEADDYLEYVIDHEIYHCLYSMYVGPQKMSDKTLWGEYNDYLNEQGADAYAVAMHIKNVSNDSNFASNIQRIRGMSLYNADPYHMTSKAIEQVINIPQQSIINMTQKEIFELAQQVQSDQTIPYDEYVDYLAASVEAMKLLGVDECLFRELKTTIADTLAYPSLVDKLVTESKQRLSELKATH